MVRKTFFQLSRPLRLYAMKHVQDKDGHLRNQIPEVARLVDNSFNYIGIKRRSCHTVRLTSQIVNA